MIDALIFDFDGLILDTERPEWESWQEIYADHGTELSLELWHSSIGTVGAFDPYAHLETLLNRSVDPDAIRAKRRPRNQELILCEEIRPGVLNLLEEAESMGLRSAVASTSSSAWVLPHLERLGLLDRFDFVSCLEMVSRPKPYPDIYLHCLKALDVSARGAVAFEDSPNGVAAAKAAGVFCVAVPCSLTKTLDLSGADLRLESLDELPLTKLVSILVDQAR